MGGSSTAQQGNEIAMASLNESKRQYNEQKAKEAAQKNKAQSNAVGSRRSANMAYSNNYSQTTDFTTGQDGGTPSILGSLLSGDSQLNNKLG